MNNYLLIITFKYDLLSFMLMMVVKRIWRSRYPVFAIGGMCCFFYEIMVTLLLTEIMGFWYFGSYAFSLVTGVIFLFIYHRKITFKKHDRAHRRFVKFMAVLVIYLYLNLQMVYLLTEYLRFNYVISILMVTPVLSVLNYFVNKYWVFRRYY